MTATLKEALAELRRERHQRERAFPRWVADGKLAQAEADKRMARRVRAIDELSQRVEAAETTGRLF